MEATERFQILAAAALMDGSVGSQELEILLKAAQEMGVIKATAEQILDETQRSKGKGLTARIPSDPRQRATLFRSLVDVVAADGVIDGKELLLVQRLGPSFGLNELEVEDLLRGAASARRAQRKK
ncbi:MAG: TerB family tellurite resistance protein [Planctomycetes bacterium]|nr:TerB family tellurite resistance protein [Planctomycetota bacterium]